MMLTQRFTPDDPRREGAFLWNYAGMNVGFFVGFTAAGYFQETESYAALFIFATLGNFVAIVLAAFHWKTLADRDTPLLEQRRRSSGGGISPASASSSASCRSCGFCSSDRAAPRRSIKAICALVALALVWLTLRHPDRRERRNMTAYLILTVGSLVFWSLYQMAPSGLQLFAVNNVDCHRLGGRSSRSGSRTSTPSSSSSAGRCWRRCSPGCARAAGRSTCRSSSRRRLLLMALAFLVLPLGIALADADGMSAFVWLFVELRVAEHRRAAHLAGRLRDDRQARAAAVPGRDDGSWMLVTGLASLFAGDFSGMIPEPTGATPAATNPGYAKLFAELGAAASWSASRWSC